MKDFLFLSFSSLRMEIHCFSQFNMVTSESKHSSDTIQCREAHTVIFIILILHTRLLGFTFFCLINETSTISLFVSQG